MKVVFIKDVTRVGRAGEVKEVADGYAKNFLLPKKLALPATPSSIKMAEALLRKEEQGQQLHAEELVEVARQLEGLSLDFKMKVMEEGRLYGSIRDNQIAEELKRLTGIDIERTRIELLEPIRQLGIYELTIRLGRDLAPKVKVVVTGEE
ncbi:MAG: 50S ribosomal protein L9 [Chloroflexi bacterium]|nr:50S ribosomal protein L9 [Chloroflexota bacterium]